VNKAQRRQAILRELADELAELRRESGLSMRDIAATSGLNQSTISRLEANPTNPGLDSLLRFADAMDADLGKALVNAIRRAGG
jgi:transcriptional regulator with XRE-family HTH domain